MFNNVKIWAFGLNLVDADEIETWSFLYSSCICVSVSVSTFLPPEDMFISYLCICFKNFGLTPPLTSLGLLQHWLYIIRIVIICAFFIADIESFPIVLVSTEHYFIFLKLYWKSWFAMLCYFLMSNKVIQLYIVQSLSHVWLFATPWLAMVSLSIS